MQQDFDSVFNQHYKRLYTMVFRMTGCREDTEDVMQEAFLNAYKGWQNFRGDSSYYTWLYKIALNTARNRFHKERRLHVTTYAEEHELTERDVYEVINQAGYSDDDYLVERVKQSCLQMFMNCMPPRYRVVFTLRVILDFSVADTAEILECSQAMVKTDLHRARDLIKAHFDGRCSLVRKDGVCYCSTFACHIQKNDNLDKLLSIRAVPQEERESKKRFQDELEQILDFEPLYHTTIEGQTLEQFKQRVKKLRKQGNIKMLDS